MSPDLGHLLIGGGLTLAGTILTQIAALFVEHRKHSATRRAAITEHDRAILDRLQEAAKLYRRALIDYGYRLTAEDDVPEELETQLTHTRMDYQSLVFRATVKVTKAFSSWEEIAQNHSQGEASAASEDTAWRIAMEECGRCDRIELR